MPLPNFIKNVFSGGASELVKNVDKLVDNLTLSKEEKEQFKTDLIRIQNEHEEKMASIAQSELDSQLKDVQGARDANVKIQESDKASWLSKNIAYCIDAFVVLLWGVLTLYLIGTALKIVKTSSVDLTGIYGLYAAVTGVAMTIINFHRGSSVGSKANGETIRKMLDK
jgi:hypothetical protein